MPAWIPPCLWPVLGAIVAYQIIGMVLSVRLMRQGRNGSPWGLAAFKKESYTAEGQRLLALLNKWWGGMRGVLVGFLLFVAGVVLCRILR